MFKPQLIEAEARGLEQSATIHTVLWVAFGFMAGAIVSFVLWRKTDMALIALFIPPVPCAIIGEAQGRKQRLQAQHIRLQLQIEANTRHLAAILETLTKR